MKNTSKSEQTGKNVDEMISRLSEYEILNPDAMSCVRGGESEGEGPTPIIITKF